MKLYGSRLWNEKGGSGVIKEECFESGECLSMRVLNVASIFLN